MENNDLILSLIMGGFLLSVIIPLAAWVYNANKEKDRLARVKPENKSKGQAGELVLRHD
jgi:hypothetical protein